MSPEEIRMVVDKAIRDGLYFPWWSYVLYFTIAMFGAWCGAYFRRKGEDQATYENYSRLREQLRKTTQDTEEIKATLLGKNWLTQQQWSIREQHYMSLLRHLTKLKLSLEDRSSYYMEPGSEYNENPPSQEEQALMQAGHESYQAIRELIGPSKVFLSDKAIDSLEELVHDHWSIAEFSICAKEYVEEALKLVANAQLAVLQEARSELALPQPNTSPVSIINSSDSKESGLMERLTSSISRSASLAFYPKGAITALSMVRPLSSFATQSWRH